MAENLWGRSYAHKADAFATTPWWEKEVKECFNRIHFWGRVMDFACNTGRLIDLAEQEGHMAQFVGIDVNLFGLELAQKKHPEAQFFTQIKGNVEPESIDSVFIIHALPQLQNPESVLADIWESMHYGAEISVVIHNKWYDWLQSPLNWLKGYKGDATIQKHYSKGELKQIMWDAGFKCKEIYFFGEGRIPFLKHRIIFHGVKA